MNPTTFAAFFHRPPPGFPKADRPQRRGLNQGWRKPENRRQEKQSAAMVELLDDVVRTFQL